MAFEPGIKLRAIELYLEMHSVPKVHEKICSEYLPVLGEDGLPSAITVRKWIEKNELPEVVKNMEIDVIARTRSREIEDLLAKKERDEMGRLGREHVMKNYNFETFNKVWTETMINIHEEEGSWGTRKFSNRWTIKEVA